MEAIGTFALVTAGCGAIVTNATHTGSLGGVGISLVFGLVIMVMIAPNSSSDALSQSIQAW